MPHIRELTIQSEEAVDYTRINLRALRDALLDPRMYCRYCERESVKIRHHEPCSSLSKLTSDPFGISKQDVSDGPETSLISNELQTERRSKSNDPRCDWKDPLRNGPHELAGTLKRKVR